MFLELKCDYSGLWVANPKQLSHKNQVSQMASLFGSQSKEDHSPFNPLLLAKEKFTRNIRNITKRLPNCLIRYQAILNENLITKNAARKKTITHCLVLYRYQAKVTYLDLYQEKQPTTLVIFQIAQKVLWYQAIPHKETFITTEIYQIIPNQRDSPNILYNILIIILNAKRNSHFKWLLFIKSAVSEF